MILRQVFKTPIAGFWDGGDKRILDWNVSLWGGGKDSKGTFVRIESYDANFWFNVSLDKTEKATLDNAKRYLRSTTNYASTFEYI